MHIARFDSLKQCCILSVGDREAQHAAAPSCCSSSSKPRSAGLLGLVFLLAFCAGLADLVLVRKHGCFATMMTGNSRGA